MCGLISRLAHTTIDPDKWWRNFGRYFHERRIEILRSMVSGEKFSSGLDIGSGGKGLLRELGIGSVTFDIARVPNLTLIASAECVPFKRDSFDLIYVGEVIEHLDRPFKALSDWARVLRPGGTLVLSTPNGLLVLIEGNLPQHKHTFSAAGMKTDMERLGLNVVEVRTIYVGFIGKRVFNFIPTWLKMFVLRCPVPSILSYDIIIKSRKPVVANRNGQLEQSAHI